MSIEVKYGSLDVFDKALKKRLDKMPNRLDNGLKVEAEQIKARTQQGVDLYGVPFKDYSLYWAQERASRGLRTDIVDLTFTGRMLNSMKTRVSSGETKIYGEIYFTGNQDDKVFALEKDGRRFFGLTDKQVRNILQKLRSP